MNIGGGTLFTALDSRDAGCVASVASPAATLASVFFCLVSLVSAGLFCFFVSIDFSRAANDGVVAGEPLGDRNKTLKKFLLVCFMVVPRAVTNGRVCRDASTNIFGTAIGWSIKTKSIGAQKQYWWQFGLDLDWFRGS